ncbi:MAG: phosphocholine cytidylyltransferase family protein [Candidatus Thermoplasmatota archaeon]
MAAPFGLILAAGFGSRLGHDIPKALIPWGPKGQTILDHQLARLAEAGVKETWVVVGFQAERVRAHLKGRKAKPAVHFVENQRFMETNTAKSMRLGLAAIPAGGVLTLNGDVVFDSGILALLIDKPGTTSLAVDPRVCGDEEIKYRVRDGRLQALNKQTHGEGEAVGLNFVAAADRPLLERALDYAEDQSYFERGIESMLPFTARPVRCVAIGDRRAMEIDFPEDLEAARRLFA